MAAEIGVLNGVTAFQSKLDGTKINHFIHCFGVKKLALSGTGHAEGRYL